MEQKTPNLSMTFSFTNVIVSDLSGTDYTEPAVLSVERTRRAVLLIPRAAGCWQHHQEKFCITQQDDRPPQQLSTRSIHPLCIIRSKKIFASVSSQPSSLCGSSRVSDLCTTCSAATVVARYSLTHIHISRLYLIIFCTAATITFFPNLVISTIFIPYPASTKIRR
jgi:hypothetical protein